MSRSRRGEISWASKFTLSKLESRVSQMGIGRKLQDIRQDLALLEEQGKVKGFFNNVENADKLSGLVEDIRDAMVDYQVCTSSHFGFLVFKTLSRRRCNKTCTIGACSS